MSLKTPESQLEELGLDDFQIVYDDEENEQTIAWLYSAKGRDLGSWDRQLNFTLAQDRIDRLTEVVNDLRPTRLRRVVEQKDGK